VGALHDVAPTLTTDTERAMARELARTDPRLERALDDPDRDGFAQTLAGAHELLERYRTLLEQDSIARQELTVAGLDRDIWQCPVVLLADVRSVGVQGDGRTYGHPVVLRPVTSEDAMTADWARVPYEVLETISTRITNEVRQVNRVAIDITSKPPGTIEWE